VREAGATSSLTHLQRLSRQGTDMDNDRIKGSAKQLKGKAKEWIGKVTGHY
jgi:hypothetical protein